MRTPRTLRTPRSAYTLIELLVVMAIIATLIGLLMSGVMAVMAAKSRTQTLWEVSKLAESLKTAMGSYIGKPQTLPSKIILFNQLDRYTWNPPSGETAADTALRLRSADALRKMFGRRFLENASSANENKSGKLVPVFIPWDGSSAPAGLTKVNILEGHQCLVFYIGGAMSPSGGTPQCLGFSTDPSNPMISGGTRMGPFYDFKSNRLVTTQGFFSYADPYGTPYAYFSTTSANNAYTPNYVIDTTKNPQKRLVSDCKSLGLYPYCTITNPNSPTQTVNFINPNGFQIISAGRDLTFIDPNPSVPPTVDPEISGGNTTWDPKSGSSEKFTVDNFTNFSKSALVAPQS